jgi:PKHD-type hydroxylase
MIFSEIYLHASEALPTHVCDDIVNLAKQYQTQEAVVGHGKDTEIRNSRVLWLREPWIFDWIDGLVHQLNSQYNWNMHISGREDAQFTVYKENQFYGWHQDSSFVKEGEERKISIVIPLCESDEYEGGDLQFYDHLSKPSLKKEKILTDENFRKKGSAVIFPSFTYHQVTKVTKGRRLSLVIWYKGERFR